MLGIQILGKKDRISFDQSIMGVHSRHEDPDLEAGDIQQALEYAAWLTREQVYTSPPTIFIICQTVNK